MVRLYDPRTGVVSDLRPARPGRLVIQVAPTADLRGQVVADTLRRTAEQGRLRVFLFSDVSPADLNIRPGMSGETADADLGVGDVSCARTLALGTCRSRLPSSGELVAKGLDPLALRLTILRHHYREPLEPSWTEFEQAHADLVHGREQVAGWARSPGRPMAEGYVTAAQARLREDLDVAGALQVLADLAEDPAVPPGAKFESFVHLDLVLALDLVAYVGR